MVVLAAIGAAAAVAGAATSAYGAVQAGNAQKQNNQNARDAFNYNKQSADRNALMDALASVQNARQLALDNQRYDDAKKAEDVQRALVNKLAMASQTDADGSSTEYDPVTGSWRVVNRGLASTNADRRRVQTSNQNNQALAASMVGGQQAADRRVQGGITQSRERALGQELLNRYGNNQGRTPQQLEAAGIERNVAGVMDPLQRGGEMAMLQGLRQGNSGNDALIGALARQGQGGTRSAIANARFDAPGLAFNERDAAAKSLLGPATTLNTRGNAAPGEAAPVFAGDASSNLMASLTRNNPAGIGSTLNPRTGQMASVGRSGTLQPYKVEGAGNTTAGMTAAFRSLLTDPNVRASGQNLADWWNKPKPYADNAPAGYVDQGFQAGDYPG